MFGLTPWKGKEGTRETWYPEHPIETLREEFKGLYDRLFSHMPAMYEPERFWNLEVQDTEKAVLVRAEVPGFEPEEIDVQLRGNQLVVKAEHKVEVKEETKEPKLTEMQVRRYERMVMLPAAVDPAKAEAKYVNGVLELHLPRMKEAEPLRIPIRT